MKTRLTYTLLLFAFAFCLSSCSKKDDDSSNTPTQQAPTVTTGTISNITGASAKCNGSNVTSDGNLIITAQGVCWSTSSNPTTADQHNTDFSNPFSSSLTHLSLNTTYHVRAYATNGAGTAYGTDVTFT